MSATRYAIVSDSARGLSLEMRVLLPAFLLPAIIPDEMSKPADERILAA
jgi:hypothetical protein